MALSRKQRIQATIRGLEQTYPILQKPGGKRMSIGTVHRILYNALHRLADEYEADDYDERLEGGDRRHVIDHVTKSLGNVHRLVTTDRDATVATIQRQVYTRLAAMMRALSHYYQDVIGLAVEHGPGERRVDEKVGTMIDELGVGTGRFPEFTVGRKKIRSIFWFGLNLVADEYEALMASLVAKERCSTAELARAELDVRTNRFRGKFANWDPIVLPRH